MTRCTNSKCTKRCSLDLTPAMVEELERIKELTNMHTSELLRYSLQLLSVYIEMVSRGKELRAVDPKQPLFDQTMIVMPIQVMKETVL